MRICQQATWIIASLVFALTFTACQMPQSSAPEAANNVAPNAASPTPTPVAEASVEGEVVTLPLIDALFYNDESFANELKSRLSMTDEQIRALKDVARTRTTELRETEAEEEYTGTTRGASELALTELEKIFGAEKTPQVIDFVRTRVQSDTSNVQAALNREPNSVPNDTRIVVNAPAYRMDLFQNGQLVKSYKVGIGYPEFPLPVGLRKAETIIFNPTWTPPDEPWVRGKVKPGQTVEAGSSLNPLGPIKIPIGLPSLIHGGKSQGKLGTFASHGCVGLTDDGIKEFALQLASLSGTQIPPEQLKEYEQNKKETKNVKLSSPIPIELRYETIVVEDGKLRIFRDVYDRDTNTEENLRRVLQTHGVSFDQLAPDEQTRIREALRQMSRDAQGNLDDANTNVNANANGNTNTNSSANKNNSNNSNSGKVTRTIKGQKEVTIELAALRGKGYPAPTSLQESASANGKTRKS